MPLADYKCERCSNEVKDKLSKGAPLDVIECPKCVGRMLKQVSGPGFRRDHTIYGNPEDGAIWDGKNYIKEEYCEKLKQ